MRKNTNQNIQTAPRWARPQVEGRAREVFAKGVRLLLTAALLAVLTNVGVLPVPVAHAATYVVDWTDDNAAATACTAAPNDCSLRGAITAANANAGADTITLPANTYTLTIVSTIENANADGDLDITDDLTINGAGAGSTIIDGNGSVTNDRVLHITTSGLTVNISGVTIRNGNEFDGGGIRNSDGTLTITDSTLSGNQVTGFGGGIYNDFGTVNVTNSTLSGNQANANGGGIFNWGTVTITDSTLSGNTADDRGGGIYTSGGTVTVTNSTLSGNTANQRGGGIFNNGGTSNVANSTLSGNQAAIHGGGIFNNGGGTSNVANSTLSGNWADQHGGGICHWSGTTNLDNVTITGNTADNNNDGTGNSGGILAFVGTVNLRNTIVAGNSDGTPSPGTQLPDCASTLTSQDYNLVGDNTGCTIAPQANDQIGTGASPIDPRLDALANNGGATQTHALQPGSPAIDEGHCTDSFGSTVTTDQRGLARPQGATCDIGAYEAQPNLSIDKMVTPTTDVAYHSTVTYTVVLSNSGAGHGTGTVLTDTLPSEVDFASWVEQPPTANEANDQITWHGTVSASTAITFAFVVTHTGDYGEVVTNTAEYSHTTRSSDYATFTVIPATYLPATFRNAQP